jgi:hypothetical protein
MIEYPFKKVMSSRFGSLLKPVIPVTFSGPEGQLDIFALLDSGADISLIPFSAGEILGFKANMQNRAEIQGLGDGSVSYLLQKVNLRMNDVDISVRVGWALIEEVPFILGRLDLFQELSIEFREFENRILLKRWDELIEGAELP